MPTPLRSVLVDDPNDVFMDGDPADFPHREEAMAEYRALWLQFLMGTSEPLLSGGSRVPTEDARKRMDDLQLLICHGPGKVWRDFKTSLPGYAEWWDGVADAAVEHIDRKFPPNG